MNILIAINPAHALTAEQIRDLDGHAYERIEQVDPEIAATLSNLTDQDVEKGYWLLSEKLYRLANRYDAVILPIGSPAFQFRFALELGLKNEPTCLDKYFFSHSVRESVEVPDGNGGVRKQSVFQHVRFFNLRGTSLPAGV